MPDLGIFIIGATCLSLGIWCIARKQISIEFGRRGFFKPKSLSTLRLTAGRAMLFGWVSFLNGLALLGLGAYVWISRNQAITEQGWLPIVTVVGIVITVLTFCFELFVEFAISMKERNTSD